MYAGGGLCVSCLGNPKSVGVLSSLAGRNVQHRLLQQYMWGGLCVSCLGNTESVGVLNSLAARMCRKKCAAQVVAPMYVRVAVCFLPS